MSVEISPTDCLEEFCLSLQFNSAGLRFLIGGMHGTQAGCELEAELGSPPSSPGLPLGELEPGFNADTGLF